MGACDLIFELRRRGFEIRADGNYLDISPADNLSPDLLTQLKQSKTEILAELQKEGRRQKAIAMLEQQPEAARAIYADAESNPHTVFLTIAVRACQQTCELEIPKAKYDPWLLLELIERHGRNIH